jgi:hypothetical protein
MQIACPARDGVDQRQVARSRSPANIILFGKTFMKKELRWN